MDNITLDDIVGSFPENNDEREKKLDGIEDIYRKEYRILNYYSFINPFIYRNELKPGAIIRYSSRIDRLSCASRIVKVLYSVDKTVSQLKLTAINKGKKSDIWEIYPELYYIFKYNTKTTRLGRAFNKAGLTSKEIYNSDNEIRNMIIKNEKQKSYNNKVQKVVNGLANTDKNKLNINSLTHADPSLASRVIRSDKYKNEQYAYPKQRIQVTSLLDDSDEESQKEYEDELGFIPDPDFFEKLEYDKKLERSGLSTKANTPKTKIAETKTSSKINAQKNNWEISVTPRRTETLMEMLKQKKKNSKTGKIKLTDDLYNMM